MKKLLWLFAVVALVCFTTPALAVDWNFYASARMTTFYESRDFDASAGSDLSGAGSGLTGGETEDDQIRWDLQGNSRLGAKVKAEAVSGQVEFGVNESTITSRRLYGVWDFGAGKLKVGKDYTPVKQFISGQAFDGDIGLLGRGTAYGSRFGQIALSFGGLEIALVDQTSGLIRSMTGGDVDEYLPKVEAAYGMSLDMFNFKVFGGYQTYEIENAGAASNDVDVDSWTLGADVGVNFGPAYVKAAVTGGSNVGNAGWHIPGLATQGGLAAFDGDDDTDDVDTIMAALIVGFKFTDMLSFEGGVGYREDDSDVPGEDEDDFTEFYLQAVISLAPGVWIIPEIGYTDFGDDITDVDSGDRIYAGAKWQIDF